MSQFYIFRPRGMQFPEVVKVLNKCHFSKGPSDPELAGVEGDVLFCEVASPLEFAQFISGTSGVYVSEDPEHTWIKMEIDPTTAVQ